MSFMRLRGRIARALLELARNYGQDVGSGRIIIRQKIGQKDLADMAGSARENVTRVLNEWEQKKLLTRLSGYYCLENKAKLEHEAVNLSSDAARVGAARDADRKYLKKTRPSRAGSGPSHATQVS